MSSVISISGPDPKSVEAAEKSVMRILDAERDREVTVKALDVMASLCQVRANIEGNTITSGVPTPGGDE